MPGERIGPYRVECRLGAGGMGEVYKAFDERLDRWVALKLVAPSRSGDAVHQERLRREARASARLNHPAVVRVYDLLRTEDGTDCIVMELVEGTPLSGLLRQGPLEVPRAVALAREVAEALVEAHALGIVHRDLKSENVLVTPGGRAKVMDFGIAKSTGAGEMDAALTAEGMVLGTCRAMAPEQAEGLEVDHRADLFALGVLLYEMVAGTSPFLGPTVAATLRNVCLARQAPACAKNPRVPEALSALIDLLLEKSPESRPGSASEVVAALAGSAAWPSAEETESTLVDLPPARAPAGGERRTVTVLSCGLAALDGGPLDPEDFLAALPRLRSVVAETVQRFEGRLSPGSGSGLLAFFGDLQAHEDDARRAVLAALEIVGRLSPGGERGPAARAGIHTGRLVVARAPASDGDLASSDIPAGALLVQGLAGPGTVLVSDATHRLVEGFFDCEELAPVALPGAGRAVSPFRIVADRGASDRFHSLGALTPLVGREQELGLLLDRWTLAREGNGQVALLAGDAGLGKSRLLWELHQRVEADAPLRLEGFGSPYHRHSAFHPVAEILGRLVGCAEEAPEARLARLAKLLAGHGLEDPESLTCLAVLLGLPAAPAPGSPERLRRRTLETVLFLLLAMAERRPLLLGFEDLHWVDPSTLELLGLLVDQAATFPLLLVITFRPELQLAWEQRSHVTRLALAPLTQTQADLMIGRLTGDRSVPPAVRAQIVSRTDGVPLFIEEMTRMILEAAAGTGPGGRREEPNGLPEIPGTLEGWLRARLDRLGTASEVAQLAAALGREFSEELLCAVSSAPSETVRRELDRLVDAELLHRRGLPPNRRFRFKHALVQDAAYASLLRADRQRCHHRIARVLETAFPSLFERQPELAAHHYTEAGRPELAVPLWQRAGERAIQASAFPEALGHLEKAVALLADLPASSARDRQEISLQVALGIAWAAVERYNAPEVRRAYDRALELCRRGTPTPLLFPVLRGLHIYHLLSGDMEAASGMASQLLELADREGERDLLLVGHQSLGYVRLLEGHLESARSHLEIVVDLWDPERPSADLALPGPGAPWLEGMSELAWVFWLLGYPEEAEEIAREAHERARGTASPYVLCFVSSMAAQLHALRREPERTRILAAELRSAASGHGYRHFEAVGRFLSGYADAALGDPEGLSVMRQQIEARLAKGARISLPNYDAFLAEQCLRAGLLGEALATVNEGLALSAATGQRMVDAELLRLRGEILLARGDAPGEAEPCFLRALEVASGQGARLLELRAAVSLARLRAGQDRKAEARALLAPLYEAFLEGLDTPDLREAAALLAILG
ncbi:MAG TPA: protein kinase [Thermoanaerobaculia bacterium]|nr:protein kinase [Thermoanaerobaculia bacterium]